MSAYHFLYVIVVQQDDGFCYIACAMDEVDVNETPGSWEDMKAEQYKIHGPDNIRIARLKTKLGWMEPLFNEPNQEAEPIEKIEAREDVDSCSMCPLKSFFLSQWYCTHPGVRDRFDKDPDSTRVLGREKGSAKTSPPDWCPLTVTPVVVRRGS